MLTGENGILKQSGKAKEKMEKASELEKIQLAVTSIMLQNKFGLNKIELKKELEKQIGINEIEENGAWYFKTNLDRYKIDFDGRIEIITGNSDEIAKNGMNSLGIPVNYQLEYTDINGNIQDEWELFYADDYNVYIISKYGVNDKEGNKNFSSIINSGIYSAGVQLLKNDKANSEYPAVSKWLSKYLSINPINTTEGMQATIYMLDSSNWTNFYNSSQAEYVIGGIPFEMLVSSYNLKNNDEIYKIEDNDINRWGYNGSEIVVQGMNKDTMYNHNESYWIASPSGVSGLR